MQSRGRLELGRQDKMGVEDLIDYNVLCILGNSGFITNKKIKIVDVIGCTIREDLAEEC